MVPEGWREVELRNIARVILGQSPRSAEVTEEPSSAKEEVPFLQGNTEFNDRFPTASSWTRTPRRTAPRNSTLISVRAPVGDVNQADQEYGIGRGLAAIAANGDGAFQDYLFWALSNAQAYLTSRKQGTTFDAVNKKDLNELPLALPPLPEQKKIAAILSSVDDAIAATRKVIEQTKRVKKGLLQELMTRGIGHTRFRKTEIGEIPEEWEVRRLREVAELQTGPFGSQLKASEYTEPGIPVVMPSNLDRGRIDEHEIARVPKSVAQRLPKHRLEAGDLVFARRGDIGRSAVVRPEEAGWLCGTGCLRARPERGMHSGFLFLASSRHPAAQWLESNALGQTMLNLNTEILGGLGIPLPPRDEQARIYSVIESADEMIAHNLAAELRFQTLKRGLMQDLLTGRVRVNVD